MDTIDRLMAERSEKLEFVGTLLETVESDSRDLVDAEQRNIEAARDRIKELDAQIKPLTEFAALKREAATITRVDRAPVTTAPRGGAADLGTQFVDSDVFRSFNGHGTSARFEADSPLLKRAPVLSTDIVPTHFAGVTQPPALQTPFLNAMMNVPVTSGSVEYLTYPSGATGADIVPEGTQKPEVTFAPTMVAAALKTYAGWQQYSRQLAEDGPAIAALINGALQKSVVDKIESDAATILAADTSVHDAQAADLLGAIRVGIGLVQAAGYTNVSAVLINPADYATIDQEILAGTVNGPVINGTIWGVPVVPVGAVAAGTAYVGDFGSGMWLFNRASVQVFVTDSDVLADNTSAFRANVLTALAEQRALPAVVRPEAIAECTVSA